MPKENKKKLKRRTLNTMVDEFVEMMRHVTVDSDWRRSGVESLVRNIAESLAITDVLIRDIDSTSLDEIVKRKQKIGKSHYDLVIERAVLLAINSMLIVESFRGQVENIDGIVKANTNVVEPDVQQYAKPSK